MKAIGIALHFFDGEPNDKGKARHDKYWRVYIFPSGSSWAVMRNWGRDGVANNGQHMLEVFPTLAAAKAYAEKLGTKKMQGGYEWLGQAEIDVPDFRNLYAVGQQLLTTTGRQPTKVNGFHVIIDEEEDILALLTST